jgi:hypothetical protein
MRPLSAPLTRVATHSAELHIGLKVPPGEYGPFPVAFKGFLVMSALLVMQLMSLLALSCILQERNNEQDSGYDDNPFPHKPESAEADPGDSLSKKNEKYQHSDDKGDLLVFIHFYS